MSKHDRTEIASERAAAMVTAMDQIHPATPADGPVTLTAVEAAYVTMIEGEYRGAMLQAQQLRAARFAVVMKAHGIVDGSNITITPSEDGRPMQLVVTPPAPGATNGVV